MLTLCISNVIVILMTEKANTNPTWGKMLTKKELLDLLARIEAKGKTKKDKEK